MKAHKLMWILWPSFLMACITSIVVFAFIDPLEMTIWGISPGRLTIYTLGFFVFWIMAALSSALSLRMAPMGQLLDEFGDPID